MKLKLSILVCICLFSKVIFGQVLIDSEKNIAKNETSLKTVENSEQVGTNGFNFELIDAGINSKFSEIGSGFFRNKFIMVSSRKLGGLAKIDANTKEPYKELYCVDIAKNRTLIKPLLFSRILNTTNSEDQVAFSPNQKTVYYTRSSKTNSLEFKLYKSDLVDNSAGDWINEELLGINKDGASIENPFLNQQGDKLYFASNMAGSIGGFDIYVSKVNKDGTLESPINLGRAVNTSAHEKYPSLSIDENYLYFSSKGHRNIGGYDIFASRILNDDYKTPRNLGNTINTQYDEVAYFLAAKNEGYVSSNRVNNKGGYDIYTAVNTEVLQSVKGRALNLDTKEELPNTTIVLLDEENIEVGKVVTDELGQFNFDNLIPFESYTLRTNKEGFEDNDFKISGNRSFSTVHNQDLELKSNEPVFKAVDDKLKIISENIYFDFAKYTIKEESAISLNKLIGVLKDNPDIHLGINAHTDRKGKARYNLKLSNKRATSTLVYLNKNGISKDRLVSKGYGETKPLIDCKASCTEEQHQSNRRVDFVILNKENIKVQL